MNSSDRYDACFVERYKKILFFSKVPQEGNIKHAVDKYSKITAKIMPSTFCMIPQVPPVADYIQMYSHSSLTSHESTSTQ